MKYEKQITYRWWSDDVDVIGPDTTEELDEQARNRICEQLDGGMIEGELSHSVSMGENLEIYCQGYWSIKEKIDGSE